MAEPADPSLALPRPLLRTRLYEQVAEQITSWIAANGLGPGDRLPPERELAEHVHLDLSVRVRKSWRADDALLDRLGIT